MIDPITLTVGAVLIGELYELTAGNLICDGIKHLYAKHHERREISDLLANEDILRCVAAAFSLLLRHYCENNPKADGISRIPPFIKGADEAWMKVFEEDRDKRIAFAGLFERELPLLMERWGTVDNEGDVRVPLSSSEAEGLAYWSKIIDRVGKAWDPVKFAAIPQDRIEEIVALAWQSFVVYIIKAFKRDKTLASGRAFAGLELMIHGQMLGLLKELRTQQEEMKTHLTGQDEKLAALNDSLNAIKDAREQNALWITSLLESMGEAEKKRHEELIKRLKAESEEVRVSLAKLEAGQATIAGAIKEGHSVALDTNATVHTMQANLNNRLDGFLAPISGGTIRGETNHFVGRVEELKKLHQTLQSGNVGVIAAVHGLGGQGKTELTHAYARRFQVHYPGGVWLLEAEGHDSIWAVFSANTSRFGYLPNDVEKNNAEVLFYRLMGQLTVHSQRAQGPVLMILDNVSRQNLLRSTVLDEFTAYPWLRMILTTRLGRRVLPGKGLTLIPVDSLEEEDALKLIQGYQPGRRFTSSSEAAAARALIGDLGGYTIAVEQVAVYLGLNPRTSIEAYRGTLLDGGLPSHDEVVRDNDDVRDEIKHREQQLNIILESTLKLLEDDRAAIAALQYAAHLPPDGIRTPWLRDLVEVEIPGVLDHAEGKADPWTKLLERLEQMRLLTPADCAGELRMHRLIAAHLRKSSAGTHAGRLQDYLCGRAEAVYDSKQPNSIDEIDALIASVPSLVRLGPSQHRLAVASSHLAEKLSNYRAIGTTEPFLKTIHTALARDAASNPASIVWQRDLSVSFIKIGDMKSTQGVLDAALSAYTEGLRIAMALAEWDPTNMVWQRDASVIHNKIGDIESGRGEIDKAFAAYSRGFDIRKRLSIADPTNPDAQRDLSVSYDRIGGLEAARRNIDLALAAYREGFRIAEYLSRLQPENAQWQRDLAASYDRIGKMELLRGNTDHALSANEKSLNIRRFLVGSDPKNTGFQWDLSVSCTKMGEVFIEQGRVEEAIPVFIESLSIKEQLATGDPRNAQWQRGLSVSHLKISGAYMLIDQPEEARSHILKCHEILCCMRATGMHLDPVATEVLEDLDSEFGHPEPRLPP